MRTRALDLDSLYGGGPDASPELYDPYFSGRFRIGRTARSGGVVPPPASAGNLRDLPRVAGIAQIADARNDENLIIAQFHLALLRFHNEARSRLASFEQAHEQAIWHYQWLIRNDYLPAVCHPATLRDINNSRNNSNMSKAAAGRFSFDGTSMPLEFSVAAFRMGHSMVRQAYDYNLNVGRRPEAPADAATLEQLFNQTGGGRVGTRFDGGDRLPTKWIADWERLINREGDVFLSGPQRFARKIDTRLSEPLGTLPPTQNAINPPLMANLARRNLRRGYLLNIPDGQTLAQAAGVAVLSADELLPPRGTRPELRAALMAQGGLLLDRTPLWYYVLREAEGVGGDSLGPLGTHVVAETLLGLIDASERQAPIDWTPAKSCLGPLRQMTHIDDLFRFAGVL